jgi:hypothetical protein
MRKLTLFFVAMILIAFTYMSTMVLAEGMKDPVAKSHEEMSLWIGKMVKSAEGEDLGSVKDFCWDPEGRVSFAIVSHGGLLGFFETKVAVPYSALTYDKEAQHFTTTISKDRFANAPAIKDEANLTDRSFADEIYRYFGQQPYWTEESMEKSSSLDDSIGPGAWGY